ncbi:TadE/TadG family type IV pilus assembly protein [Roseibium sp. SCP14]|uniref:TadE/TadG family type IV pilus assembly protein n=1 Tax=Roseibium sp. SCP14 TaxID=3141375 RepID=UPI003335A1A7
MRSKAVCSKRIRQFKTDSSGVAATEFALLLPFIFMIFIGVIVVTDLLNQDRKVSRIASSVTDLVAQAQSVSTSDLDAVMNVGNAILAPYTTDDLEIIVSSVTFNKDGAASVIWSRSNKTGAEWDVGKTPPVTLPDAIMRPNTSIVIGQTNLNYTSVFADLYSNLVYMVNKNKDDQIGAIELSDTYYLRPRLTDTVECPSC